MNEIHSSISDMMNALVASCRTASLDIARQAEQHQRELTEKNTEIEAMNKRLEEAANRLKEAELRLIQIDPALHSME